MGVQTGTFEDNWFWCSRCEGLFFNGNQTKGRCPAGGSHGNFGSGLYRLLFVGSGQPNWRRCQRCEGLFFFGSVNFGRCPAAGVHDPFASADYVLEHNAPFVSFSAQSGWCWCRKCQGLFFAGHVTKGRCPAGAGHDPTESGQYSLLLL